MSACLFLFSLRLAPLFSAIAEVESDRGATSANVYQIRQIYIEDVNRICGLLRVGEHYAARDVTDREKSQTMMCRYWQYYGAAYLRETGNAPTYEVLARIHNGGPRGWAKKSTLGYWAKVRGALERESERRGDGK